MATIKEHIIQAELKGLRERVNKLIQAEAPDIMIDMTKEEIKNLEQGILKIGGDKSLLDREFISCENKVGNSGKRYVQFNNNINYFPNAKYGRYIAYNTR